MEYEFTTFPKLKGALLEIRSATNVPKHFIESFEIYQAQPRDVFELTGNVVRCDSHSRNDIIMKLFVEAQLDPDDNTIFWVPLNIHKYGPDHFVSDKHRNELGPMCYTDYSTLCVM